MKHITLVVIFCQITNSQCLTCAEILDLPSDKKWTLSELETIKPQDIVKCLAHLSKDQLPTEEANYIWQSIISYYEGIANIPDTVLMTLHWVTPAVTPEDYGNLTLDNIDVIENFGLNYNLNRDQLAVIADRVREDFAGKEPEDYTYYDLMALKQILCEFNRSEILRIHPLAYREAALMIGKLENCGSESMIGFATLAMNATAFGSPDAWTKTTIHTMGKVAEYLPHDLTARFKVKLESDKGSTSSEQGND